VGCGGAGARPPPVAPLLRQHTGGYRHGTARAGECRRLSFFKDVRLVLVSAHCTCLCEQARFRETQGLVFVADGSDRKRIREARDELHRALDEVSSACQAAGC